MVLFLNTTDLEKITLAIISPNTKVVKRVVNIPYHESYKTLGHLTKFLSNNKISRPTSIIICSGPGSFTGIRVGVSIAKALGFAWDIPVLAIKKNKIPRKLETITKLPADKKMVISYGKGAV